MENWVTLIQRQQGASANPPDPYADEAFRRFRLDLVDEQETLAEASIDRVRECFRALVRSPEITDDNDGEVDRWVPPAKNKFCLVLDAGKVQMLASLTFRDDADYLEDFRAFEACRVQAVDIAWQRPERTSDEEDYRGVREVSIVSLARAYASSMDGLDEYDE